LIIGSRLTAHVETWRPYTSTYPGLLALAAACLWQDGIPRWPVALAVFAAPVLGWVAALYGCDFLDSDVDRVERPHRPIPSGRLSEKEAIIAMLGCVYLGLLASAWLGLAAVLFAGAAMVTSVLYGMAKQWAFLGPLARGLAAPCAILFGSQAVGGDLGYGWPVLVLFFLHDVTTNLVGEIRDAHGDAQAGCRTFSVRYGARRASWLAVALFVVWETIAAVLPFVLGLSWSGYYVFYGPALALAVAAMVTVGRRPEDRRAGLFAHKCFVLERLLLAGSLLAAVSMPAAALIVLPLLALAHLAQTALRDRHEFGRAAVEPTLT
jgi:4-hydroxybenzoate polyprenyltransferase